MRYINNQIVFTEKEMQEIDTIIEKYFDEPEKMHSKLSKYKYKGAYPMYIRNYISSIGMGRSNF